MQMQHVSEVWGDQSAAQLLKPDKSTEIGLRKEAPPDWLPFVVWMAHHQQFMLLDSQPALMIRSLGFHLIRFIVLFLVSERRCLCSSHLDNTPQYNKRILHKGGQRLIYETNTTYWTWKVLAQNTSAMDSIQDVHITIGFYRIPLTEKLSWPPPSPNPPRKGNFLVEFMSVLLGISTIAVILRLYTRAFLLRRLDLDDLFIIPGYLAAIGVNVSEIYTLKAGWGYHVWDFDLNNARLITVAGYSVQITITFSCLFTKLSLLLSYLRFAPPGRRLRFWILATIIFTTAWNLGFIIPCIISCNPPHLYWDTYIRTPEVDAKCLSPVQVRIFQYLLCGFNIISDIITMVLPIPTVWKLQLPRRQKWSLLAIFLAWTIVIVAAVLRLTYSFISFSAFDALWYGYDLWIYVALEAHIAVVCACAPGLKPLIVQFWPKFDTMRFAGRKKLPQNSGESDQPAAGVENPESLVEKKPKSKKGSRNGSILSSRDEAERAVRAIIASALGRTPE
ncbi:hypothetical protein ABW19_dt0204970 [Dactylella cylindrospora]|nr:hypothetical protein ABW19_dt0204970 [Dactylella cylindrospora]